MRDPLTKTERSALMAKVRSKGNRSTEGMVQRALRRERVRGWTKHPRNIEGHPDFYFPKLRVAVFVDGCFWHGCPRCGRLPRSRVAFWRAKIDANRRRDREIRRHLRSTGVRVVRVWEHQLKTNAWLRSLVSLVQDRQSG